MIYVISIVAIIAFIVFMANRDSKARQREEERMEEARRVKEAAEAKEQEEIRRQYALEELKRQAQQVQDTATLAAIDNGTYNGPLPEYYIAKGRYTNMYPGNIIHFKIAGISYRSGIKNYVGAHPAAFVPEPKNEYDPNAIKIVAEDGHHLGYVPRDETATVRKIIGADFKHYYVTAYIDEYDSGYDEEEISYYGRIEMAVPLK